MDEIGLLAAGKEFGVFNEVDVLRSLSVELSEASLTTEEAKEGFWIMKGFMKLGISPEQHLTLIKVCGEIDDPGFIHAAIKLHKVESDNKMTYEQVISKLERVIAELPIVEKKLHDTQAKLESTAKTLKQKQHEKAKLQDHLQQLQNEAKAKESQLNQEFMAKIKRLKVKEAEVDELSALKIMLAKSGLDIPTIVKLAKEFGDGNTKDK